MGRIDSRFTFPVGWTAAHDECLRSEKTFTFGLLSRLPAERP